MTSSWVVRILSWLILLSLGLLLLYGRYNWTLDPQHARIGFFCSAYYFLIIIPVLYYLVSELTGIPWIGFAVTGSWWVAATLPYHWLNLERFFYPLETLYPQKDFAANLRPLISGPDWFPQAVRSLPAIPHEVLIFSVLAVFGLGGAIILVSRHPRQRNIIGLLFLAYSTILAKTWLHLSHRSPYLYYTLYDKNPRRTIGSSPTCFQTARER